MNRITGSLFVATTVYAALQIAAAADHGPTSHGKTGCCHDHCGVPGRDGRDGRDGIQGPFGPPGAPGEKGSPGQSESLESTLERIINILTDKMSSLIAEELRVTGFRNSDEKHKAAAGTARFDSTVRDQTAELHEDTTQSGHGGSVYTRWGRNACPSHSTTLYQGLMVGSHYKHEGSGSNHLCLPLNPQWNKTYAGRQSQSYLYGTELELHTTNPVFHQTNSGGVHPHNRDVQCAVCYTPGRPSHLMIPARLECPVGWTVEYLGFLMAAHHTHKKTEYVCVDQDPDTHPGTAANVDGNLIYKVEVVCGPLPCPNYVDGYEVTCIVCTK